VGFVDVAALVGDTVGVVAGLVVGEIDVAVGAGNVVGADVGEIEGRAEHSPHVAPLLS
jgi:hypothetical protein